MTRSAVLLALALAQPVAAQDIPDAGHAEVATRAAGLWVAPPEIFAVGQGASATVRRTATLTPTSESLKVEAFLDATMTQPLLTYDSGGPMRIVGPWEPVPGAYAVELLNERATVTAHIDAPEVWDAANLGDCPLVVGQAVDISDCASGPPFIVVDCLDLDLILLDEAAGTLRFGAPGTDRCVERPTAASDLVFTRQ